MAAAVKMAESVTLQTPALMEACAAGGDLIMVRAAVRTARVFAEELAAASEAVGLPAQLLRQLSAGLWLLSPATASTSPQHEALCRLIPFLGGVRLRAGLLCAAVDVRSLIASAQSLNLPLSNWSLEYEVHYPAADHAQLPFHRMSTAPELIIGLHAALGKEFTPADGPQDALSRCLRCVSSNNRRGRAGDSSTILVLETKTGLLLSRLQGLRADTPVATAPSLAEPRQLPQWVPQWDVRPFAFSASLDPLVAVAAVNLAVLASIKYSGVPFGAFPPPNIRVFDPCVGSGTVLAAALALGISEVDGSDLRSEFIKGASNNMEVMAFGGPTPRLHVHDACEPFPPELLPREGVTTLVVSNPPWGKNIGSADDGARIVRSIASQFASAIMCFMVNGAAVVTLREMSNVEVLRHVKLGSVELVVARAS